MRAQPLTTTNTKRRQLDKQISIEDENGKAEDLFEMQPRRKKQSDYSKRNTAKARSSTHNSSMNSSRNSKQSSGDSRIRSSSFAIKSRQLPANFAEQVLDLELSIDQGKFTMDTINELLLLYSQAVEYYNGINDDKYQTYSDRI